MSEKKFNLSQTGAQVQEILNSAKSTDQVLTDIQEAMENLPDGQAVSAQVALNTAAIQELDANKASKTEVVFDISAYHATGGVLAEYADLTAALGANGANIPDALRKGGMSVKFVQSSDNKYVQYRLMSDTFSITETDWQKQGAEVEVVQENTSASNGEGTILINGVEKGRYALADKQIGLVGIASSVATSGVAAVGDIFYLTTQKKFFRCTNWTGNYSTSDYVIIPPYRGAIYVYNNVLYTWDFTNNELITYVTIEQDPYLEGYDVSINNVKLKGILAGYQKGDYYLGSPIDKLNFASVTTDNDNIFVIINEGYRHIKKIRYISRAGTINFYKVYAPSLQKNLVVSKTLITSVQNDASENDTIKEIDVDFDLLENEHLGINGSFRNRSLAGYNAFHFPAATNIINNIVSNLAFAVMAISDVSDLSILLENRESKLLDTYGENGVGTANSTPEYVFITEDSTKAYPKIVRYIEVELNSTTPTEIYKVTLDGNNSTVELLGSAKGNGVTTIPLNVTLASNQRIGISNRIRYKNSGADERYRYMYLSTSGGAVTETAAGSIVCYKLHYVPQSMVRTDNTVIVDANGKGDYLNIHEALKGTLGKDTAEKPVHIKVMPGIYNEPTLPFDEEGLYCNYRYLSIVGVDKENCIIRNDKGYYNGSSSGTNNFGDNAPIKVNGNVYIANLTIISTDDEAESEDNVYHRSYCIHTDAWANQNTTLEIHNCILKNNHAPCVGFGIPKNNTLKITACELYTQLYNVSDWASNGAVICGHDKRGQASTEIDEHLFIKDCVIKSDNTNAVVFINNKSGLANCIFINNAVDVPSGMGIDLDTGTSIDKLSYGNALVAMNYSS